MIDEDDHEAYVLELYEHILNRKPRPDELANWTKAVEELGARKVFSLFTQCQERADLVRVKTPFHNGHYYSPIVDPATVTTYVSERRNQQPENLSGILIDKAEIEANFATLAPQISTCPFAPLETPNFRYFFNNTSFPASDALILYSMVRTYKPRQIIEIGSGYSTACMLDAAEQGSLSPFNLTCIDPDCERLRSRLRSGDEQRTTILEKSVQEIPLSTFRQLRSGDILFIDSTHVLKTGSDVHYELFEVLPSLAPGVFVHFHDIQYPFEYPNDWIFQGNYSWNETYALRAFLMYNRVFKIHMWSSMLAQTQPQLMDNTSPWLRPNPGGSLWLRRAERLHPLPEERRP